MAVVVKHTKHVETPDDGTSEVGSDEWNANHAVTGLENVDNTSDANKPVSTAQAAADAVVAGNAATASAAVAAAAASALTAGLANKVVGPAGVTDDLPAIFNGATGLLIKSKTYAAFKTLLALVKGDVELGNVDNTTDIGKPVSTAQAAAIAASTATVTATSLGLGNVTNTSDANKPISTAQAAALALKANLPTVLTATLGADVALNSITTFFAGPSVAQGVAGTWLVQATVTVLDTTAALFYAQITDGTTVIASSAVSTPANFLGTITLIGVITSPAGNLRVLVKDIVNTSGLLKANQTGLARDTTITAVRIA